MFLGCCLDSTYWYVVLMFSWKFTGEIFFCLTLEEAVFCLENEYGYLQIFCGNI